MADTGGPEIACSACSALLPANARFCLECGTPVVAADAVRQVRKTVTLLFTDVTGSTAMGESLDPEAYRGVMGRYFDVARAAVERHGGTVEKFVGDAVLAVFGVPDIREDDALRAVRAADELNAAVRELSTELTRTHGVSLAIRTGVNTGAVVVGTARAGGSFATGDAVNTAARLEQAAGPGDILLGADTWRLVRDAVEVEPVEPVVAKGKAEPVSAYRLLSVRVGEAGVARRPGAPMVGRDRETRALDDALERTLESGRSHLVTVLGAPGIGKTRLVSDFVARVGDRADVVSGRCVSYGQGITFFPVVQVIRAALRLVGGESDEIVRHSLATAMADAADATDVVDLLLPLLGSAGTPGSHDQTFWAVRRLVEQLAQRHPLVVTVDDLHWAEPSLLDLLAQVQDEVADLPFLLICGARPELLEEHPDWGRGSLNSVTFGLEPFDRRQIGDRVRAILGEGVSDDVVTAVADWSGGNPLFVEEIVSHLVEEGALAQGGGAWTLLGDPSEIRMPPSVSALLAARLDRVPETERELLERVSVIGLEFTSAEAVGLVDASDRARVPVTLAALARRDLLRRVRTADGESWAFRHITIRDAAYDVLPKALRAELHERFADDISDVGAERLAFVGHHLEQAARLRRELAPHDPTLAALEERAAAALSQAGSDARLRDDVAAALTLLRRATDLTPPESASRREVLVRVVELLNEQYRINDVAEVVDQLAEATTGSSTPLDELTLELERLVLRTSRAEGVDPHEVLAVSDQVTQMAAGAGDSLRLSRALFGRATAFSMLGRWDDMRDVLGGLIALGDARLNPFVRISRGPIAVQGSMPLSEVGPFTRVGETGPMVSEFDSVRQRLYDVFSLTVTDPSAALAALDALGPQVLGLIESHLYLTSVMGELYQVLGALDGAVEWFGRCVDGMRANDDEAHGSTYLAMQALSMLDRGDPVAAVHPLVATATEWTSPYDVLSVALLEGIACVIAARSGDLPSAHEHAGRSVAVIDSAQQPREQADLRRRVSECARLAGDVDTERRRLTEARDLYRAKEIFYWARVCQARLDELG
jgi:class 3 adenylate cyclase